MEDKRVKPKHKWNIGDLVKTKDGDILMIKSNTGYYGDKDRWRPFYDLCPINKDGRANKKKWFSYSSQIWVEETDLEFISEKTK